MDDLFDEQRNNILNKLNQYKSTSQSLEHKELNQEDLNDLLFDVNDHAGWFLEEAEPIYERTIEDIGNDELDKLQFALSFDVENPRVQEWLANKEQQFAQSVNETTWNTLKDTLNEGISKGEGIPGLASRVEDTFDGAKANRSEMIARTEVNGAANFGAHEGYQQSGVVEEKEWIAALDERTRTAHVTAHTQIVKMDEKFDVGGEKLEYPGDPSGSPGNIINCRCTLVPKISDEETPNEGTTETPDYIPDEASDSFNSNGSFDREGHKQHMQQIRDDGDYDLLDQEDQVRYGKNKYHYIEKVNDGLNKDSLKKEGLLDDNITINTTEQDGKIYTEVDDFFGDTRTETVPDEVADFIDEFNDKDAYEQLKIYNRHERSALKPSNLDRWDSSRNQSKALDVLRAAKDKNQDKIEDMREAIMNNFGVDNGGRTSLLDSIGPYNDSYQDRAKQFDEWLSKNLHKDMTLYTRKDPTLLFDSSISQKGYYKQSNDIIKINPGYVGDTAENTTYVHEIMHSVHENNNQIKLTVKGYFSEKTEGIPFDTLSGYDCDGYEAGFMEKYAGRVYAYQNPETAPGTEVLTRSVEYLHKEKTEFFTEHLDEFNLVMSTLRGLMY